MKDSLRYILIGLAIILSALALWYFKHIVAYILVAAVISLVGRPIVEFLRRIRIKKLSIPNALSALVALLTIWILVAGFFIFFVPLIINQGQELSNIDIEMVRNSLDTPFQKLELLFERMKSDPNDPTTLEEYIENKVFSFLNLSLISSAISDLINVLGNLFIAFFSISFISFFFLKDENLFGEGILLFVPTRYEENFEHFLDSTKKLLTRYFTGIFFQITGIIILNTAGLSILGLNFQLAAVIGLITGILNVIPYVGPLIGASLGLFLGIVNHLDLDFYHEMLPLLGQMAIVFIITQIVDNILFQPLIYGTSVKAHPMEIFLVILIAGSLAGIAGMILAITTYTVLRVFAREFFNQFKISIDQNM